LKPIQGVFHCMRIELSRLVRPLIATCLAAAMHARAQQIPASEPPLPMPSTHGDTPTLRVTTQEVLVPTLVEKRGGGIVYGLKQEDFVLEDNGVPQKIRVQEEMDTAPVALVVAVEEGGLSALEFNKLARLGPLLDVFLSDGRSQAALVGFDSEPHLMRDFTHSSDDVTADLKHLEAGDGGDAILDTVSYAVDLLESQPKEYRRILLLISEERDHGGKHTKPEELIEKIGRSDVLVLSVAFSPAKADTINDLEGHGAAESSADLMAPLMMAIRAMRRNVAKQISVMSGGDFTTFTGDKGFEARVVDAARHARNRYLITFSPSNPTPGLHTIRVRTAQDYGARIVARANYWLESQQ
jgi:VWFA-related protein